jgi:hypothetical protein
MKQIISLLFLLLPILIFAQSPGGNLSFVESESSMQSEDSVSFTIEYVDSMATLEEDRDDIIDDFMLGRFADEMPEFPGGMDSLYAYLARTLEFPQDAKDKGVSGAVLAEFVVEKDGSINRNIRILKSLYPSCDREVARVIVQMPAWEPGKLEGKPVRCVFNLPIRFVPKEEENETEE